MLMPYIHRHVCDTAVIRYLHPLMIDYCVGDSKLIELMTSFDGITCSISGIGPFPCGETSCNEIQAQMLGLEKYAMGIRNAPLGISMTSATVHTFCRCQRSTPAAARKACFPAPPPISKPDPESFPFKNSEPTQKSKPCKIVS